MWTGKGAARYARGEVRVERATNIVDEAAEKMRRALRREVVAENGKGTVLGVIHWKIGMAAKCLDTLGDYGKLDSWEIFQNKSAKCVFRN